MSAGEQDLNETPDENNQDDNLPERETGNDNSEQQTHNADRTADERRDDTGDTDTDDRGTPDMDALNESAQDNASVDDDNDEKRSEEPTHKTFTEIGQDILSMVR